VRHRSISERQQLGFGVRKFAGIPRDGWLPLQEGHDEVEYGLEMVLEGVGVGGRPPA
jgi:hypothetical protein